MRPACPTVVRALERATAERWVVYASWEATSGGMHSMLVTQPAAELVLCVCAHIFPQAPAMQRMLVAAGWKAWTPCSAEQYRAVPCSAV